VKLIEPNYLSQFHQHFARAFFVQKFVQSQLCAEKSCSRDEKFARKMLMKLTPSAVAFALCNNGLVKLIPGADAIKLFFLDF